MGCACKQHTHLPTRPTGTIIPYPRSLMLNQRRRTYDPTHTTTLRNRFASEMNRRFIRLRGLIRRAIVDEDCFGLVSEGPRTRITGYASTPGTRAFAFAFERSSDKISSFMDWLRQAAQEEILEFTPSPTRRIGRAIDEAWTDTYIHTAYQKGIERGRAELIGAGYNVADIDDTGGIRSVFNQPVHADRAGVLYTRTFEDLRGITEQMDGQISRVLSQGILDGKNPRELARDLTRVISGPVGDLALTDTLGRFIPAQRRAQILARTEIIRAHHMATIQEYENWGVEGVHVQAELKTAGDSRVCPECLNLEGNIYTLEEARNLLPIHPQCRCICLPTRPTLNQNRRRVMNNVRQFRQYRRKVYAV